MLFEVRENNLHYDNNNSEDKNDIFFCLLLPKKRQEREREHGLVSEGPSPRQEEKKLVPRASGRQLHSINMS